MRKYECKDIAYILNRDKEVKCVPWSGLLYSHSRAELAKPTLAGEQKGRTAAFATMVVYSSFKHSWDYSLRGQKALSSQEDTAYKLNLIALH